MISLQDMQKKIIINKFYPLNTDTRVRMNEIERDGRKLKKTIKKLVESSYIEKKEDIYCVTDHVYNMVKQTKPIMLEVLNRKKWVKRIPLIPVQIFSYDSTEFNINELKYIYEHNHDYKWYVIDHRAYEHTHRNSEFEKEGPFDLKTAQKVYASKRSSNFNKSYCLAVSSEEFESSLQDDEFNKRIDELWKQNLGWGLYTLGILSEKEAELVKCDDGFSLTLQSISSYITVGKNPENWGNSIEKLHQDSIQVIESMQKRITLLYKISLGVQKYGGWDKFLKDYKNILIAETKKLDKEKPETKIA